MNITECFKFVNDNYTTNNKWQQLNACISHTFSTSTLFKGVFIHTDADQRPTTELKNYIMVQLVRAVFTHVWFHCGPNATPTGRVSGFHDDWQSGGKKSFVSSTCVVVLLMMATVYRTSLPTEMFLDGLCVDWFLIPTFLISSKLNLLPVNRMNIQLQKKNHYH